MERLISTSLDCFVASLLATCLSRRKAMTVIASVAKQLVYLGEANPENHDQIHYYLMNV